MEVLRISQEYIKPSSPTPPHLNTCKFSLLDNLMPPIYVPMILFYPPCSTTTTTSSERSQALKQALSETLCPLAGRIRSNLCIDCNDKGAYYIEAKVESHDLLEFLQHPDLSQLPKFLPPFSSLLDHTDQLTNPTIAPEEGGRGRGGGASAFMLQVTNFACSGFVIGVYLSHMIIDGVGFGAFLKAWAAATAKSQSAEQLVQALPKFDGAALFPRSSMTKDSAHPAQTTMRGLYRCFAKKGRCVTKSFVFDASAVAKLKKLAATSSLQNPSRVEAVSAFIWKCARDAWKVKSGRYAPSLMTHAVNLRRRADPDLPTNCIGNYVCLAGAIADDHQEVELSSLEGKMREATSQFDSDLVAKLQGQGRLETLSKVFQDMDEAIALSTTSDGEMNFIGCTSIAYSGLYDADFSWGNPLWVAPVHEACREAFSINEVRLMDTGEWGKNGFEAWISLAEEETTLLQSNPDFLAFASNFSMLASTKTVGLKKLKLTSCMIYKRYCNFMLNNTLDSINNPVISFERTMSFTENPLHL